MLHSWKELAEKVERAIEDNRILGKPEELYLPIDYSMRMGGKRIRPTMALMAAELFGKSYQVAVDVAMAIEIFHNFTLVHDDIMDEAPIRRGKPTVHQKWGRDIAILSGDVMFVKAYQYLCKTESQRIKDLLVLFNQTAIEVCEGQQMDMNFETTDEVSLKEYIEMIQLKTATLVAASLKMGAMVAGANGGDSELLYDFGINLGIAFQIQDDYLDAYADPDTFGKRSGGDIISNKKTYLLLTAFEQANQMEKQRLKSLLALDNQEQKVEETVTAFNRLRVPEITKAAMESYYHKAMSSLSKIGRPEADKKQLISLANYLMERSV